MHAVTTLLSNQRHLGPTLRHRYNIYIGQEGVEIRRERMKDRKGDGREGEGERNGG